MGFRYLIKNDEEDLSVLVKRSSEIHHMPYRKYNLKNLGSLSPLKPLTPLSEEEKSNEAACAVPSDGFLSPKSGRPGYIPKDEIFFCLKSFLDGVIVDTENRRTRGSQIKL